MNDLFPNLMKALNSFGPKFINNLREELIKNDRVATGNLVNSLSYEVSWNGGLIELSVSFEDYLKYVCEGTKPHWPNVNAIRSWISAKHIAPKPMKNGKLPTQEQLAYLIGRKISKEGTKGTHDLENVQESNWNILMDTLDDALDKDISENVDEILTILWK